MSNQVANIADRIMVRVRAHGVGRWVCTPKDFLDLGSRAAVDQALSRLTKAGQLRRVARGLYDLPRFNAVMKRSAPPDLDSAIQAVSRRDDIRLMPDGIVAAHQLGLTNAVPAKVAYVTDGRSRTVKIAGWTVRLRHASPKLMRWADRPAASAVQALLWLGPRAANDPQTITTLRKQLPDAAKRDLSKQVGALPGWAIPIAKKFIEPEVTA
ncbi:MAG: type IV toxin-antitoxin system AbiEi family antitoxin domain-containing protein [Deltaproteobacteria bacterium]|nr:type IV toxin-antitoxin system AbiEi family antitoxin domain-containing protein [Deltaproteobacteria bacterium]